MRDEISLHVQSACSLQVFFLYEMLLSLFFVAILGVFADTQEMQLPLALFAALMQILLPAVLSPLKKPQENFATLVGGFVYFAVQLTAIAQLIANLFNKFPTILPLTNLL